MKIMANKVFKRFISISILLLLFISSFIFAVAIGAVKIPWEEIIEIIFFGVNTDNRVILMDIRLPRVM